VQPFYFKIKSSPSKSAGISKTEEMPRMHKKLSDSKTFSEGISPLTLPQNAFFHLNKTNLESNKFKENIKPSNLSFLFFLR